MSNHTSDEPVATSAKDDPLLGALRHLPSPAMDDAAEGRVHRTAHAAFVRHSEGGAWSLGAAGLMGRVALPAFLACIVGLYMTWAFAAATAIVH